MIAKLNGAVLPCVIVGPFCVEGNKFVQHISVFVLWLN